MTYFKHLFSLDLFGGIIIVAMILVNFSGSWGDIYGPLKHLYWEGLTPFGFIFSFFIFIVGVSITLSSTKHINLKRTKNNLL